jgi:hypothetical protein
MLSFQLLISDLKILALRSEILSSRNTLDMSVAALQGCNFVGQDRELARVGFLGMITFFVKAARSFLYFSFKASICARYRPSVCLAFALLARMSLWLMLAIRLDGPLWLRII